MTLVSLAGLLVLAGVCAFAQDQTTTQGAQPVTIQAIRIKGSRLPEQSVQRLTGLQTGQKIDEQKLRTALQNANNSGLFKNIVFNYESAPDSTDVTLELVIEDQLPLVPATIRIAKVNSEDVWHYLASVDPLFTRELPPSTNAIDLYARYITKYLESLGQTGIAVIGNALGKTQTTGIEFVVVKLR